MTSHEKKKLYHAGGNCRAGCTLDITATSDLARVQIGSGATLLSEGDLTISARGTGSIKGSISEDTFGVGTVAIAKSRVNVNPTNEVEFRSGSTVRDGDINVSTGEHQLISNGTHTLLNQEQITCRKCQSG